MVTFLSFLGLIFLLVLLLTGTGDFLSVGLFILFYKSIGSIKKRKREKEYEESMKELERACLKREQEEFIRTTSTCNFDDGISHEEFRSIIINTCKPIKRLIHYEIDGLIIRGTVIAQSGISKWNFQIDFNDYGHLTGNYWLKSDNYDSNIPNSIAENIKSYIVKGYIPKKFN